MTELLEQMQQLIKQARHDGYQAGLSKGYELGWQAGQVEKSNRAMIDDKEIADNMKDYWMHQADGAEK
ncbi:MAG TPA: hypothetical protein VMW45_03770 [Dehalococcoidia bacterium]|nr:hypothetical protein [Dehalococcoidia bacterium]